MQFNSVQREIAIKLVYYGPPLSGKTTNLQKLHELLNPKTKGRLTTLDTSDDRTLFFDMLPVTMRVESGYSIKLKLYTVPGQVIHAATRRLVLAGADGVAYIADCQRSMSRMNNEFWHGMRQYLSENKINPDNIPIVIQFNKCDLPDTRTEEELESLRRRGPEPIFSAVAISGEGVLETLRGLLEIVIKELNRRYDIEKKFNFSAEELFAGIFSSASQEDESGAQP